MENLNNLKVSELELYHSLVRLGDSPQIALETVLHKKQGKCPSTFWNPDEVELRKNNPIIL